MPRHVAISMTGSSSGSSARRLASSLMPMAPLETQRSISPIDKDEVIAEAASLDPPPDELVARNERGARLREFLIATLEPLERRVFVLHYGDEMPLDAITRLLRLDNASGAKAYIVSARRKLARATQRLRNRGGTL